MNPFVYSHGIVDNIILSCLLLYAAVICLSVPGANAAMDVALLFFFGYFFRYYKSIDNKWLRLDVVRSWLLLLSVMVASALIADNQHHSAKALWFFIYNSAPLFVGIAFFTHRQQVERIPCLIAISVTILSLWTIWQGSQGIARPSDFLGDFVLLGAQFSQLLPFLLVISFYDDSKPLNMRIIFLGVIILGLLALLFNATRGAWLAIVVVGILFVLFSARRYPRMLGALVGTVLILGLVTGIMIRNMEHNGSVAPITRNSASVYTRVYLWQSAVNMFIDHPILGVGFGNYHEQFAKHYVLPGAPEKSAGHAHNTILNILAELGFIGLAAYLYLFFVILRHYWRAFSRTSNSWALAMVFSTIGLLVQSQSDYNLANFPIVMQTYWYLVGITWFYPQDTVTG